MLTCAHVNNYMHFFSKIYFYPLYYVQNVSINTVGTKLQFSFVLYEIPLFLPCYLSNISHRKMAIPSHHAYISEEVTGSGFFFFFDCTIFSNLV